MIIVHFEVYVLEGRGWMLHARFPRLERDEAVREAKELESTLGVRVKVLRETYNTDANSFDEAEVYKSGTDVKPIKRGGMAGGGGGGGSGKGKFESGRGGAKGKGGKSLAVRRGGSESTASAGAVAWRLMLILLVASAFSLGALRLVPTLIVYLYDFGFRVTPDGYGQLLFVVFGLVFLFTAVPLALRYLPRHATIPTRRPTAPLPQARQANAELKKSLDKLVKKAKKSDDLIPEEWADDPALEPAAEEILPEIIPGPDDADLPEIKAGPEDEEPLPPLVSDEDKGKAKGKEDDSFPKPAHTPAFESAQKSCDRFLDDAIKAVRRVTPTLDKYNTFALNLYMAGAVESVAYSKRLDDAASRQLLKTALEALGAPADMAARFHDKVSDYMMEPRYMRLIQAGRGAMDAWGVGDEAGAHNELAATMKEWNKPTTEKKASIMTVMFTDMVGSTDLTQARGDAAAQEIVRKHNAIVRTVLSQFAGKEIKHTGDGIMASFASAANAVEATVQIQRQVLSHNEKQPNLPLHLRIGLNAGEPIQEEDDLFGTTVQLAARVCAATESDQTLCTPVVKDLAFGKNVPFVSTGEHALKGFRDKIQLWEVVWR
ncbi:conserved hypothetical protein [Candidatus Terasakiella magnetica]|nr:conserved hypothetical protein [Candidatus Terasakiella magnetica]